MSKHEPSAKISQVETTSDILTGRGGQALFVKYLNGVGVYALLDESFGKMRKSLKGQAIWKGKIIDAVFRGGQKHSNYGNTAVNMITDIVNLIRRAYRSDVTIIVQLDSGFFDEDNFAAFQLKSSLVIQKHNKIWHQPFHFIKNRSF